MNFERIRQAFQPLFRLGRREAVTRLLYAILISVIVVDSLLIVQRLWATRGSLTPTLYTLIALLLFQLILLYMVNHGHTNAAVMGLVIGSWMLGTYQAWRFDGVHDISIFIYFLVILVAALLTNWRISIGVSLLSIVAVWILAIREARGLVSVEISPPFTMAADLTAIFVLLILLVYLVVSNVIGSLAVANVEGEKFRKVFHVSPVAISITSLQEGRLLDANDAFFRMMGYERNLAIGKTTIDLGFWSHPAEREKFVRKMIERRSLDNPAFTFTNQSGQELTSHAFYELIEVEKEPAILAMFHDISEQNRSQQALQASEEKYRNFVEQSMEGIWLLGFDHPISLDLPPEEQAELIYKYGYVQECNDVVARMYGYHSSEEFRGVRVLDVDAGETLNDISLQSTLKLVKDGYRSASRETMERMRNGEMAYFLNNAVGVIENNHLVGLWGTQLDITALKKADEALRRSEARTRSLLNAIPDMIFEFNRDGTILQFIPSESNEPLLPPEQFIGKTLLDVMPQLADQTNFSIKRALESGHVHAFQYKLFQDGRDRTFEARFTPLEADTVLAMVRDITLQKWIEEEREKLILDLESKTEELEAKNAELERFTYTVSHDLKSPLITIRGFLGFLKEDSQNGNLVRLDADIKRISDATEKMQKLLNDLLELSRVGRLVNEPKEVQLNELIAETLELLHGRISQGEVSVSVSENLPVVFGDHQRLLEVMQNLIDNAAKFMGSQPHPRIEIGQSGFRNDMPILYVRDNGIGIAPEFQEKIFGLFNKLDARGEGTGVGLALVKRIIEFHHGSIWVESEPGRGTTFLFTLPTPPQQDR